MKKAKSESFRGRKSKEKIIKFKKGGFELLRI